MCMIAFPINGIFVAARGLGLLNPFKRVGIPHRARPHDPLFQWVEHSRTLEGGVSTLSLAMRRGWRRVPRSSTFLSKPPGKGRSSDHFVPRSNVNGNTVLIPEIGSVTKVFPASQARAGYQDHLLSFFLTGHH